MSVPPITKGDATAAAARSAAMTSADPRPYFFVMTINEEWHFIPARITYEGPSLPLQQITVTGNSALSFERAWFSKAQAARFIHDAGKDLMHGPDLYYLVDKATDTTIACAWKPDGLSSIEVATTTRAFDSDSAPRNILIDLKSATPRAILMTMLDINGLLGHSTTGEISETAKFYYDYKIDM